MYVIITQEYIFQVQGSGIQVNKHTVIRRRSVGGKVLEFSMRRKETVEKYSYKYLMHQEFYWKA